MTVSTLAPRSARVVPLKLFHVQRNTDDHGNTGTGIVAEGVIFSSGQCAIRWLHEIASISIFASLEELIAIHGHNGKTVVIMGCDGCPVMLQSREHCSA